VRDEPQRGLNVEVAAFEVIKRKRNEHVDRAILFGTRRRCRCTGSRWGPILYRGARHCAATRLQQQRAVRA
jgi:hypothetical protein